MWGHSGEEEQQKQGKWDIDNLICWICLQVREKVPKETKLFYIAILIQMFELINLLNATSTEQ